MSMDESNAFRLQQDRKVSFFDCHRRFLPLSHEFRSDKESFQKGKGIIKGPPKQKLGADIVKMLGELKESQNMVDSKVTTKSTTELIKVVFGNSLMQRHGYYSTISI
jgi:hypothetical protein